MSFMQVVANSAFEVQFPGDALPFTLVPGKNGYGAIMNAWVSDEDREFFSDMYPRLRPGLVVAQCNGTSTDGKGKSRLSQDIWTQHCMICGTHPIWRCVQVPFTHRDEWSHPRLPTYLWTCAWMIRSGTTDGSSILGEDTIRV